MTRVAVLTSPGTGAIATVAVSGPQAWEVARQLFHPVGRSLPELPEQHRFWFGTLGEGAGDEVVLAVTGSETIEVHCHGGRRVVRWIVEQFLTHGCEESREPTPAGSVLHCLQRAPTLRTAAILLDQFHGAFDNAIRRILSSPDLVGLDELARLAPIGRHLVEPWKVAVAGPPNVGKSSLVNALAGYQRAVVSEIAGTTRDAVRVQVAFDGWPVELIDTAGLCEAQGLEAEGIALARSELHEADLVLWVMDGAEPQPVWPDADLAKSLVIVINKCDLPRAWSADETSGCVRISAMSGMGIPELVAAIVRRLVPDSLPAGAAVPFTPQLASLVDAAAASRAARRREEAGRLLRDCIAVN